MKGFVEAFFMIHDSKVITDELEEDNEDDNAVDNA